MKRTLIALMVAALPAAAVLVPTAADASPPMCAGVPVSAPQGTRVESVKAVANPGGIIDDPQNCHWDARRLTGTKVLCAGKEVTISAATADGVRLIWQGPPALRQAR